MYIILLILALIVITPAVYKCLFTNDYVENPNSMGSAYDAAIKNANASKPITPSNIFAVPVREDFASYSDKPKGVLWHVKDVADQESYDLWGGEERDDFSDPLNIEKTKSVLGDNYGFDGGVFRASQSRFDEAVALGGVIPVVLHDELQAMDIVSYNHESNDDLIHDDFNDSFDNDTFDMFDSNDDW